MVESARRRTAGALLALAFIVHLMSSVGYSYRTPVFEGPDESDHYTYASYLSHAGRLPRMRGFGEKTGRTVADEESLAHHPPLYYGLLAATLRLIGHRDTIAIKTPNRDANAPESAARHLVWEHGHDERALVSEEVTAFRKLRFWSVLFGLGSLWLCWRIGRVLFPDRPRATATGVLLLACLPMWSFLHGVINNDSLAILLSHAVLYQLARAVSDRDFGLRRGGVVGVLLGLALLTKLTCMFLVPLVALVYIVAGIQNWQPRRRIAGSAAACVALALLLCGWFFIHNQSLYGDPFAQGAHDVVFAAARVPDGREWEWIFGGFASGVFHSFLGNFGWLTLPLPGWLEIVWVSVAVLAAVGLFLRPPGTVRVSRCVAWIFILAVVGVIAFAVRYNLEFRQPQGRFLFPAVAPIFLAIGIGLGNLAARFPARVRLLSITWVVLPVGLVFWVQANWFGPRFEPELTATDEWKASLVAGAGQKPAPLGIALQEPADGSTLSSPPLMKWAFAEDWMRRAPVTISVFTASGRVVGTSQAAGLRIHGPRAPMPPAFFAALPVGEKVYWNVRLLPERRIGERSKLASQTFSFTRVQ